MLETRNLFYEGKMKSMEQNDKHNTIYKTRDEMIN